MGSSARCRCPPNEILHPVDAIFDHYVLGLCSHAESLKESKLLLSPLLRYNRNSTPTFASLSFASLTLLWYALCELNLLEGTRQEDILLLDTTKHPSSCPSLLRMYFAQHWIHLIFFWKRSDYGMCAWIFRLHRLEVNPPK